jgi:hypothetical protein
MFADILLKIKATYSEALNPKEETEVYKHNVGGFVNRRQKEEENGKKYGYLRIKTNIGKIDDKLIRN